VKEKEKWKNFNEKKNLFLREEIETVQQSNGLPTGVSGWGKGEGK
jgi:hypothetical protein